MSLCAAVKTEYRPCPAIGNYCPELLKMHQPVAKPAKKLRKITDITLESLVRTRLKPVVDSYDNYSGDSKLYASVIEKVERPIIKLVLEKTRWNQRKAATLLGINRNTLHDKIIKLGITR
jgi:two-component system nitrogen regulation response regulator GlnG